LQKIDLSMIYVKIDKHPKHLQKITEVHKVLVLCRQEPQELSIIKNAIVQMSVI